MKELGYLNKYFVKYKFSFLLGIVTTIIAQFFSLYTPKLISKSLGAIEQFDQLSDTQKASETILSGFKSELVSNILLPISI